MIEIPAFGTFSDLIQGLHFVKGIMDSTEYNTLLLTTISLSVMIGLYSNITVGFIQNSFKRILPLSWIFGTLIYIVLIQQTIDVIVVNKDLGKMSPDSGNAVVVKEVPIAPALFAWLYGQTTNIFGTLIQTHGTPILEFGDVNMDISYKLLTDLPGITSIVAKVDPLLLKNIKKYIDDCVMAGVSMDRVSINSLMQPGKNGNIWSSMNFEGNMYTMPYYLPLGATITKTCNQAHAMITNNYKASAGKINDSYCKSIGYEGIGCKNLINKMTANFLGKLGDDVILDYLVAKSSNSVLSEYIARADKQVNIQHTTAAIMAEKWLPALTANMFSVVLLFTPLVFLLVFLAPGGVLKYFTGMAAWLILWNLSDMIIFCKYQREIYEAFKEMRTTGIGLADILGVSNSILEKMGMYGKMRWATMTLSLGMTTAILRIGNHAMANMAQDIGNTVSQAAGQMAGSLSGFGGLDLARDQMLREKGRAAAASMNPDSAIYNEAMYSYQEPISYADSIADVYGSNAADIMGATRAIQGAVQSEATRAKVSYSGGIENYTSEAARADMVAFQQTLGNIDIQEVKARLLGIDIRDLSAYEAGGRVVTEDMAKTLGNGVQAGDIINFGMDKEGNVSNMSLSRHTDNGVLNTVFNNDGSIAYTSFSGLNNGRDANFKLDADGNLINYQATSGSAITDNNTHTINKGKLTRVQDGKEVGQGFGTKFLSGDASSFEEVFQDIYESGIKPNSSDLRNELDPYIKSITEGLGIFGSNTTIDTVSNDGRLFARISTGGVIKFIDVGAEGSFNWSAGKNLTSNEFTSILRDKVEDTYSNFYIFSNDEKYAGSDNSDKKNKWIASMPMVVSQITDTGNSMTSKDITDGYNEPTNIAPDIVGEAFKNK